MAKASAISKAYKRKINTPSLTQSRKKTVSRKDREYLADFGTLEIEKNRDSEDEASAQLAEHLQSKQAFTEDQLDEADREFASRHLVRATVQLNSASVGDVSSDEDVSQFDILMNQIGANKSHSKKKKSLLEAFKSRKRDLQDAQDFEPRTTNVDLVPPQICQSEAYSNEARFELGSEEEDDSSMISDEESTVDQSSASGGNPDFTDYYEQQFSESTEQVSLVSSILDKMKTGTLSWMTLPPLADHVTYQAIFPHDLALSSQEYLNMLSTLSYIPPISQMGMRTRVLTKYLAMYPTQSNQFMDLLNMFNQYNDVLWTGPDFIQVTISHRIRRAYCLHVLNHVYKSRTYVLRNDAKLTSVSGNQNNLNLRHKVDLNNEEVMKKLELQKYGGVDNSQPKQNFTLPVDSNIRDQGFTRPKVLILVPMRNLAWDIISMLMDISGTDEHANKNRFKDEYFMDTDSTNASFSSRPVDYKVTFRGNVDDCFTIGVSFSKKSMKLYSQFYKSDVIVASPLGLRLIVEKEKDVDFLSSIETVIVDSAHVLNMQNWDHLIYVFDQLNQIPKASRDTDFSRLKAWYLDDLAKNYRQTIILSEYIFPELTAFFNKYAQNVRKPRLRYRYPVKHGSIVKVLVQAPQTYTKLEGSLSTIDELRFKYFVTNILPQYRPNATRNPNPSELHQKHLLLFIPSYFDYVPIRNYMDEHDYEFEAISEYTDGDDKMRARTLFYQGRTRILVYTERTHFFRRLTIKGALHIVFYSLPENARFYSEICNFLALPRSEAMKVACQSTPSASDGDITVLYSKWDAIKLERIVGPKRVSKLLVEGSGPFVFRL